MTPNISMNIKVISHNKPLKQKQKWIFEHIINKRSKQKVLKSI